MNYYNPYLADWLSGPAGQQLAKDTTDLVVSFNTIVLEPVYGQFKVPIANVTGSFLTTNFTSVGGTPINVLTICKLTWMCDPQRGPDIHPNRWGYSVIAFTFYLKMLMEDII